MIKKRAVQIWVDPDFKKGLKIFAARENVSIMEATKKINETINTEDRSENIKRLRPKYKI